MPRLLSESGRSVVIIMMILTCHVNVHCINGCVYINYSVVYESFTFSLAGARCSIFILYITKALPYIHKPVLIF